jgi:predicted dehydrogenase
MIAVAVIGAGHWGPNLIRNLDNGDSSRVAWIVDRDRSRLDSVSARFPDARVSGEASEAIADRAVDAVVIATPTSTHYELARSALEHGTHDRVE